MKAIGGSASAIPAPMVPRLVASILLSIASLGPTLAVWAAGSHELGVISRVWQMVPIPGLLLVALCLLFLSAKYLWSGTRRSAQWHGILPAVILVACAVPWAVILGLVTSMRVFGVD